MLQVDAQIVQEALSRSSESVELDFKSSFDTSSSGEWLSLVKDVAALANSGGGVILFGLTDDGSPSGNDVSGLLTVDPADFTNRVHKYTGIHFHDFEFIECQKSDSPIVALLVGAVTTPIVFTRVGTFEPTPGQQKTLFSVGTVYFRHGAKSEPGTSEDLRSFFDRQLEVVKKSWLDGIAKVVEAPPGSRIAIVAPEAQSPNTTGALPFRLSDDPSAPAYYAVPIDKTHPYRQKEVIKEVNARIGEKRVITSHDILCIRRAHEVQKDIKFCYTQNYASPRYSSVFVDWIVASYEADTQFFEKAKHRFEAIKGNGS